jgi:CDP-diacylglycerol--serine O-phosphatidyltransferase
MAMQIRMPLKLRKLKDSGKQRLFVIPFLFTFANACLGMIAVLYAWEDCYVQACYCIIGAAISDLLDGRLARAFGSCSPLGMELDSLCDAISFCFAPAMMLYGAYLSEWGIMGIMVAGIYLCAGLFRLAKFNNTACQQKSFFIGMSTPVAAIFFAMIIIYEQWIIHSCFQIILEPFIFIPLVLSFAYFMVSCIRFPTFKTGLRDHMLTYAITLTMVIACIVSLFFHAPVPLAVLLAYTCSSVLYHVASRRLCIFNS